MEDNIFSCRISPNFKNSHHFCRNCKHKVADNIVKCPDCDNNISICSTYKGNNYYLQKKYIYELEEEDFVLLRGDNEAHRVLDIKKVKKEKYRVALEYFRAIEYSAYDIAYCVIGSWDEGNKPWKL